MHLFTLLPTATLVESKRLGITDFARDASSNMVYLEINVYCFRESSNPDSEVI